MGVRGWREQGQWELGGGGSKDSGKLGGKDCGS